jgi:thymidylate synthase (FAD)
MSVKLIWITPDAEKLLGYIARVSNPQNQDNENVEGLLRYMVKHQHWSPFEMASAVFEIETTRDIARQILRHRSFSFQEFSQRYADVSLLPAAQLRECRLQDTKNRQNSLTTDDQTKHDLWSQVQAKVSDVALAAYQQAIEMGVAKEQARAVLPEGLTPSRLYMSGTIRSWMHYCQLRTQPETQKEHRLIAQSISDELARHVPAVWSAMEQS